MTQEHTAQKEDKAVRAICDRISNGLAAFLKREHLTQRQLARGLGIGDRKVSGLLKGDRVCLDMETAIRVMCIAGVVFGQRDTDR